MEKLSENLPQLAVYTKPPTWCLKALCFALFTTICVILWSWLISLKNMWPAVCWACSALLWIASFHAKGIAGCWSVYNSFSRDVSSLLHHISYLFTGKPKQRWDPKANRSQQARLRTDTSLIIAKSQDVRGRGTEFTPQGWAPEGWGTAGSWGCICNQFILVPEFFAFLSASWSNLGESMQGPSIQG